MGKQKLYKSSAYIEITNACHLRCRSCVNWTRHGSTFMSLKTYKKILNKLMEKELKKLRFYWRGESYLHPQLPDMMEMAKERGIQTFCPTSFSTRYLSDETYVEKLLKNITRFGFNIDGYDQQSLNKYRVGADWNTTIKNLETIDKMAETIKPAKGIWLRVLMFRYNELNKQFFDDLPKKHEGLSGVAYIRPTILGRNILTRQEATEWLATNPKYQRYMKIDYKQLPKKWLFRGTTVKRTKNHGWIHKSNPRCGSGVIMISVNGDVGCCGQDTDLKYKLGNILTDDLQTIYENHNKLATKMYHRQLDICKTRCLCHQKDISVLQALKAIQSVE